MANKKISACTELTSVASGDVIPILDVSDGSDTNKKTTIANINSVLDHGGLAGLADNDHPQYPLWSQLVGRNKIINGGFCVWQNGYSGFTSNGFTADMFRVDSSGSTHVASAVGFTPGQTDVPGNPTYFHRSVVSSVAGADNYSYLRTPVESVRTLAGKKAILSFYAKADANKNLAISFSQNFGTGTGNGTPSGHILTNQATKAITASWAKYTVAVDIPSISGKIIGSDGNDYLNIWFFFDGGANTWGAAAGSQSGTFDIALVQLEEDISGRGEPSVFEDRGQAIELMLCKRYYQRGQAVTGSGNEFMGDGIMFSGCVTSGSTYMFSKQFPVTMRGIPNVTVIDIANNNSFPTTWGPVYVTANGFFTYKVANNTSPGGYFTGTWVADARL